MRNNRKSKNTTIKNFLLSTNFLFFCFWLIGSFIVILGIGLSNHTYGHFPSDDYTRFVLLLGLPWIIFACIVIVVRKEVPRLGLKSIKGGWAVFQGVLVLILSGSTEIYLLYTLFQEMLSK